MMENVVSLISFNASAIRPFKSSFWCILCYRNQITANWPNFELKRFLKHFSFFFPLYLITIYSIGYLL